MSGKNRRNTTYIADMSRLRWDKPPREADRLETLARMLKADQTVQAQRFPAKASPAPGWRGGHRFA
jgi:hypothetical protein